VVSIVGVFPVPLVNKGHVVSRPTLQALQTLVIRCSCCHTAFVIVSVPSKKILHWANVCSSAHAIAQPCRHINNQALQELCGLYTTLNLDCF